jgi:phosphoglycerate dehydrogenase-like enzyme
MAFQVGVTAEVQQEDGSTVYDLSLLDEAPGVEWRFLSDQARGLRREHVDDLDGVIVFMGRVTAETLSADDRPLVLARLGVGYDTVDVDACTERGVLLMITPDGVRRPMASSALAFMLALGHALPQKDSHIRAGGWDRFAYGGVGLTGRTLGLIGVGNVDVDLVRLVEPFAMRCIAHDPYVREAPPGVELVALETVFRESDFVVVLCPLTEETRGLVDADRLATMKHTAFLINIARGPIVDQAALTEALRERGIAGAALDVFEQEPINHGDPLLSLENVILAPHSIGLTDEIFRESGRSACRSVIAVSEGRVPPYVANREALDHPRLRHLR